MFELHSLICYGDGTSFQAQSKHETTQNPRCDAETEIL